LEQYFGFHHNSKTYYKIAPQCIEVKKLVEEKVGIFAKEQYAFNFDILFKPIHQPGSNRKSKTNR
jgi:hypothetical protein